MGRLGAMVIGQSPRPDVEAEVRKAIGVDIEIDLRGALDGLSRAEIDGVAPENDADTLFTRLPGGDGVRISKAAVIRHGEAVLAKMMKEGHDAVVVLCTGEFPEWSEKYRVIYPSRIMSALVGAVFSGGTLGVFTPLQEQAAKTRKRWQSAGYEPAVVALSPNAAAIEIQDAARRMRDLNPSLLVFDCISYTSEAKAAARQVIRVPGILGVTAAARVASELVS